MSWSSERKAEELLREKELFAETTDMEIRCVKAAPWSMKNPNGWPEKYGIMLKEDQAPNKYRVLVRDESMVKIDHVEEFSTLDELLEQWVVD